MTHNTMGDMIAALRREHGMTQKELAEQLNVTDKAVSKWERNAACPDTGTLPRLAEVLGVTIDELMTATRAPDPASGKVTFYFDLVLRVIPLAMGVAVVVTSLLGELVPSHGLSMLGLGLACVGLRGLMEHD